MYITGTNVSTYGWYSQYTMNMCRGEVGWLQIGVAE